jgi:serine/threonine-protein kinase RsbW
MFETSSSPSEMGDVMMVFADFLRLYKVSESGIEKAIVVLRELLINAMKHGNRYNRSFPVTVKINQLNRKRFKISVKDLGNGFDYQSLDTDLPDNPRGFQTRGYKLIKAFTDSFEFNQKGNQVTAYISTSLADQL